MPSVCTWVKCVSAGAGGNITALLTGSVSSTVCQQHRYLKQFLVGRYIQVFVCLPVCLSVCVSVCLPVCLSVCLSVCLYRCQPAVTKCHCMCLSVFLFLCPFLCLSLCLLHLYCVLSLILCVSWFFTFTFSQNVCWSIFVVVYLLPFSEYYRDRLMWELINVWEVCIYVEKHNGLWSPLGRSSPKWPTVCRVAR